MIAVPAETPVVRPPGITVATEGFELDHVPPVRALASTEVLPIHAAKVPVMAGEVPTVTVSNVLPPGKE